MTFSQLKAYKNELIVGAAFIMLVVSFFYKQGQVSGQLDSAAGTSVVELKEIISLKKVWGDKQTTKKVDKLKSLITPSKQTWSKKSKKLTASFKNLSNQELNKLVTKCMNLPVQIQKLEVKKLGESYQLEFKCKW